MKFSSNRLRDLGRLVRALLRRAARRIYPWQPKRVHVDRRWAANGERLRDLWQVPVVRPGKARVPALGAQVLLQAAFRPWLSGAWPVSFPLRRSLPRKAPVLAGPPNDIRSVKNEARSPAQGLRAFLFPFNFNELGQFLTHSIYFHLTLAWAKCKNLNIVKLI
jgi:hypothetical protein